MIGQLHDHVTLGMWELRKKRFAPSEETHTRWKDGKSTDFYGVLTSKYLCKSINQAPSSVKFNLPVFSLVQTTSLWRILCHKRENHSPENLGTKERKSSLWHYVVTTLLQRKFITLPQRCQLTSEKLSFPTNWKRKYNQWSDVVRKLCKHLCIFQVYLYVNLGFHSHNSLGLTY